MKILLPISFLFLFTAQLAAQNCAEIFISEYVEGYGNNRALELYNPTSDRIDLSQYSVGRFSNGSTEFTGIRIPAGNFIEPNGTFVIALDKRDSVAIGLETPIWNGYQLWDTCIDRVSMMPILDNNGNIVFCVQYDNNGLHLYGTEYHDFLDLEGKANIFLCPDYNTNNAMYFNGNDAVALIKGTTVDQTGSNIIDVVGVIGEDPESTVGEPGWVDRDGRWLTYNKTLVRKREVKSGTKVVAAFLRDTFAYVNWEVYPNNTFLQLGAHDCVCDLSATEDQVQSGVSVFPNPVNHKVFFTAEKPVHQTILYDLFGKALLVNAHRNLQDQVTIDLGQLKPGFYILSADFGGNDTRVFKIFKQ